jgi:acyl carrier protein
VEQGEIENRLLSHDYIKEAVVIPKKNRQEETRLYAYLVTDKKLGEEEIREYLLAGLPDYMVPAKFICLEEIPLSPNGKVDRQKLMDMSEISGLKAIYTPPRTPTEKKLAQIWRDELELEKVGIKDNYFNIGGDSIKSISLLNLVNKTFETKLKIVDLYSNNTIEQLALNIQQGTDEDNASEYAEVLNEVEAMKNRILKEMKGKTNGN